MPVGMPHPHPVSPRMPVVLQVQLTLACLTFLCRSVCHPQEGSVLADGLLLGSTGPGPSQFSFSRVWNKSPVQQAIYVSLSFRSLLNSSGP